MRRRLGPLLLCLCLLSATARAEDALLRVDTRPGVTTAYFWMPREGATHTVVLLTGGAGGIGYKDGAPTSNNFLVRSRDWFAAQKFNVAIVGKPSDTEDLDLTFRISSEHMTDLKKVVTDIRARSTLPIWLIGTSRGTTSATAAAIAFGDEMLSGIVLTSSVTSYSKQGAVPRQALGRIRLPVLVMHHEKDACKLCAPHEAPYIIRGLDHAPVKKLILVSGGANPTGDVCEALHWHGYIGMEKEAVGLIADWIRKPVP